MESPMRLIPALALTLMLAPPDSARADAANTGGSGPVAEVVTFRLVAGITSDQFLAAARATAAPLRKQPGFQSRRLTLAHDGTWTDLVIWASLPQAQAAATAMMAEPEFQPFMAMIAMDTVRMRHDRILWQMD
jgi:hypothetical protein